MPSFRERGGCRVLEGLRGGVLDQMPCSGVNCHEGDSIVSGLLVKAIASDGHIIEISR